VCEYIAKIVSNSVSALVLDFQRIYCTAISAVFFILYSVGLLRWRLNDTYNTTFTVMQ